MPRPGSFGFSSDPQLLPRIQHLKASGDYIDAEELAHDLQAQFPEYGRRKFRDFVRMVKAGMDRLEIAESRNAREDCTASFDKKSIKDPHFSKEQRKRKLLSTSNSEPVITLGDEDSDSKTSKYVEYPDTNMANKSLMKLYGNKGAKQDKASTSSASQEPKRGRHRSHEKNISAGTSKGLGSVPVLNVRPEKTLITFADLGGCETQFLDVCRLLTHLKHPEVHEQLGVTPPRGFLLHGPPGCGKTLFAEAVAGELDLPILRVASTELVAGVSGESEEKIRILFSIAADAAPCILLLDEIDAIAPKRESAAREMEKRIVSQLIACLDDLHKPKVQTSDREMVNEMDETNLRHVLVIGTTSRPDSIETALRRAGRFDKEIALGIPDERARIQILRIVCRGVRLGEDVIIEKLARLTPGYVGADLKALAREASMCAVNRILGTVAQSETSSRRPTAEEVSEELHKMLIWLKNSESVSEADLSTLYVTFDDFEKALRIVHPSAKREGFATVPDVTWENIGALHEIREELQWSILYPIKRPEDFELLEISNKPQGILLCGPPGCGKTLLVKAVANETGMNFISVKGPELLSMYVGESERAVRTVFQRARDSSPCVIFFDEIDALCPKRSSNETAGGARLVNQLLTEMDGISSRKQVFLIGATNRPDIVDPAILRPGRLDKILFVDFPSVEDRADILGKLTENGTRPRISPDVSFEVIAANPLLEWFTGADLAALVHEAGVMALKQRLVGGDSSVDALRMEHFHTAMELVRPSVAEKDRANYARLKTLYTKKKQA